MRQEDTDEIIRTSCGNMPCDNAASQTKGISRRRFYETIKREKIEREIQLINCVRGQLRNTNM